MVSLSIITTDAFFQTIFVPLCFDSFLFQDFQTEDIHSLLYNPNYFDVHTPPFDQRNQSGDYQ